MMEDIVLGLRVWGLKKKETGNSANLARMSLLGTSPRERRTVQSALRSLGFRLVRRFTRAVRTCHVLQPLFLVGLVAVGGLIDMENLSTCSK